MLAHEPYRPHSLSWTFEKLTAQRPESLFHTASEDVMTAQTQACSVTVLHDLAS